MQYNVAMCGRHCRQRSCLLFHGGSDDGRTVNFMLQSMICERDVESWEVQNVQDQRATFSTSIRSADLIGNFYKQFLHSIQRPEDQTSSAFALAAQPVLTEFFPNCKSYFTRNVLVQRWMQKQDRLFFVILITCAAKASNGRSEQLRC